MKIKSLYVLIIILTPCLLVSNNCEHIMDNERVEIVIKQMNGKSKDIDKLNLIKKYLTRLCMYTEQMLSIMNTFESDVIKNDFFLYSKDYIVDIQNYNKINSN